MVLFLLQSQDSIGWLTNDNIMTWETLMRIEQKSQRDFALKLSNQKHDGILSYLYSFYNVVMVSPAEYSLYFEGTEALIYYLPYNLKTWNNVTTCYHPSLSSSQSWTLSLQITDNSWSMKHVRFKNSSTYLIVLHLQFSGLVRT